MRPGACTSQGTDQNRSIIYLERNKEGKGNAVAAWCHPRKGRGSESRPARATRCTPPATKAARSTRAAPPPRRGSAPTCDCRTAVMQPAAPAPWLHSPCHPCHQCPQFSGNEMLRSVHHGQWHIDKVWLLCGTLNLEEAQPCSGLWRRVQSLYKRFRARNVATQHHGGGRV